MKQAVLDIGHRGTLLQLLTLLKTLELRSKCTRKLTKTNYKIKLNGQSDFEKISDLTMGLNINVINFNRLPNSKFTD